MNRTRYVLSIQHALLVLLWAPTLVWSADVLARRGTDTLVVDWMLVAVSCVLSTMMGLTTLGIRVNQLLMTAPTQPLVRPWLFAAAHMGGSWSAGTLGFLIGQAQGASVWTSLIGVVVMSFGGAKGFEIAAEKYLPVIRPRGDADAA